MGTCYGTNTWGVFAFTEREMSIWTVKTCDFSAESVWTPGILCACSCVSLWHFCPWLHMYILNEMSLAQLSLSCIIPLATSALLYPSAQGLCRVWMCECMCASTCAYVKACSCNPHPATSNQVFSVTSAIPRGKSWSCVLFADVESKFGNWWAVF